jgi:hypothetical protein
MIIPQLLIATAHPPAENASPIDSSGPDGRSARAAAPHDRDDAGDGSYPLLLFFLVPSMENGADHALSVAAWYACVQSSSTSFDLFTPTEEHGALREMLANFVKTKVDPQVQRACIGMLLLFRLKLARWTQRW